MTNHKKRLPARLTAALLVLAMVLALAPTALAATGCPMNNYGEHIVQVWEAAAEANCHEDGIRRGVCSLCGATVYDPIARDLSNHDAVYTDEGNGYHSGVCAYHPNAVIPLEKHTPNGSGVCSKCGAVDYSGVILNLPADLTVPVALNSVGAKLSAGEVKLTLGSVSGTNVTDDYTIYYNWYYNGTPVANTAEYALPDTITGKEGTYRYTLFVSAVPKSTLRDNVSGSCNVTVTVEDLISASATVSIEETSFYLGDPDTWSGESVSAQIYAAVQDACPRTAGPDYVVFHTLPSSNVGSLNVSSISTLYYFEGSSSRQHILDDVRFTVASGSGAAAGDYTVGFTAYDTARNSYPGVLVITVQQYAGDMDVVTATTKDGTALLSTEDFQDFWNRTYANGTLDSIRFEETPRTTEGSLYIDYISSSAPGVRVTTKDNFYVSPGSSQYGIDEVTFISGVKQTEYVTLDFEARGFKNNGQLGSLSGTVYIFIQSGGSADIALTAASAGTALPAESFQKAYQSATGGTGTSFYIQLLEVPGKGALYVNRTSSRPGTLLTQKTVANYPLSYSDSRGESISSVTYVPAAGTVSETIRYVACSSQGKPLYTGQITFSVTGTTPNTSSALVLNMTSTSAGVKLSASSFENLPGALAPKLAIVSFTPPSAAYGTLYYGRTASTPGTAITSSNTYFSAVTTNPPAGSFSLDNLTFVPAAGVNGVIPIAFTASDTSNNRYTGTLRITVTSAGTTTTPGTTTPGTTTPGTTLKTFSDVPSTQWSYPYITALASSGVLNGYEDGTFKPANPVTLGEALKMIMVAANPAEYANLAATRTHWASGYLDRAVKDGLLASGTDADLARNVDRYTIAEIATKAMKLSPIENAAVSPFSDMALTHASAKYVLPLYQLQIFTGSTDAKTGKTVFYGVNAIKREEFAAVVWRMQSYVQTGTVGTVSLS